MCGICCIVERRGQDGSPPSADAQDLGLEAQDAAAGAAMATSSCTNIADDITPLLLHRGPDAQRRVLVRPASDPEVAVTLLSSILHLRGPLIEQPTPVPASSPAVVSDPIDLPTQPLLLWNGEAFDGLPDLGPDDSDTAALARQLPDRTTADTEAVARQTLAALAAVRGPFAVVFLHQPTNLLFFGRDQLGRRSLVWHQRPYEPFFAITSVPSPQPGLAWDEVPATGIFCLQLTPSLSPPCDLTALNGTLMSPTGASMLLWHFPWAPAAPPGSSLPPDSPSHVLPPLVGALRPLAATHAAHLAREDWTPAEAEAEAARFLAVLEMSVRRRVLARCSTHGEPMHLQPLGLLFSGGIDSMLLAAVAHLVLPPEQPIELLNVAFANTRCQAAQKGQPLFSVPDRQTGLAGLAELQALPGDRDWRFVAVNVPRDELEQHRPHIRALMRPLDSVMDDSIACALWFAARGQGELLSSGGANQAYTAAAKVLLLGMGADEQLAGYGRHRCRFNDGGWDALHAEVALDLGRISSRNLGRDDRCVTDHGREARFPFLDEDVVNYLSALPIPVKADLRLPRGVGEKKLLRDAARLAGLGASAALPKRAIQFGSRIAKLDSGRDRGTDKLS